MGDWDKLLALIQLIDQRVPSHAPEKNFHQLMIDLTRTRLYLHAFDYDSAYRLTTANITYLDRLQQFSAIKGVHLVLAAQAAVGLARLDEARQYFARAHEILAPRPENSRWFWRLPLFEGLANLALATNDIPQSRHWSKELLASTLSSDQQTWRALAWELSARLEQADGNLAKAQEEICKALATVERFDTPLATWRVHCTAAHISLRMRDFTAAESHRKCAMRFADALAASLEGHLGLKAAFASRARDLINTDT
jgi:hypothetical protein